MGRRTATLVATTAAVILALLAGLYAVRRYERARPVLVEVRVVTASTSDPVFRSGARHLGPAEGFELAVALRLEEPGRSYWLAPVAELEIDGRRVDHRESGSWPERDRLMRVLWFTVESSILLGTTSGSSVPEYTTFLAASLGRGPRVAGSLAALNDDLLGLEPDPDGPGTLRFRALVEVVKRIDEVVPLQTASSAGAAEVRQPGFAAVHRSMAAPPGIEPAVGELFLLPAFEPDPGAGDGQRHAADMAGERIACSSWTFAATAVAGDPTLSPADLRALGTVTAGPGGLDPRLRWGADIRSGDLLRIGPQWLVLLGDGDGDGHLGAADQAMQCWRQPPRVLALTDALGGDAESTTANVWRHEK